MFKAHKKWTAGLMTLVMLVSVIASMPFGMLTALAEAPATDFAYNDDGANITITGYNGAGGEVVIPALIDGKPVTAIANEVFKLKNTVTSVVFPNSVTTIGQYAFQSNSSLTTVTLPSGLTSISNHTFNGCTALTSIAIPSSVTSIGSNAFYGSTKLTAITIPDSVTSVGDYAFNGCTGLTTATLSKNLTSLGTYAFYGCSALTSIEIPGGVPTVSGYAFRNCSALTSVVIKSGVSTIGSYAFRSCSNLKTIVIPASVTSISSNSFTSSTTYLTIYGKVGSVAQTFATSYNVPFKVLLDESPVADFTYTDDGTSVTITGYVGAGGQVVIPAAINELPVTAIGNSAFYEKTAVSSIVIPDGVTMIGSSAFYGCSNMTAINIPTRVTVIGSAAFSGCSGLTGVILPSGVTEIGASTFAGCTGLTSFYVPSGISSIGSLAFNGCSNLASIAIRATVTSIGDGAFTGCAANLVFRGEDGSYAQTYATNNSITFVVAPNESPTTDFIYSTSSGSVTITGYAGTGGAVIIPTMIDGNPVTAIGNNAFQNRTTITSVVIPEVATSIGSSAFQGCSGMTSITIPNSVTTIGQSALNGCSVLASVKLPTGLTSLSSYIFSYCTALTTVEIPASVTSIGTYAFSYSGITSITIPSTVTAIGDYAFQNCTKLTSITLSEGLRTIGSSSFYTCSALTSIYIPSSVTSIGAQAFRDCTGLLSFTVAGSTTSIGSNMLYNCNMSLIIYGIISSPANTYANDKGLTFKVLESPITDFTYSVGETSAIITGYIGTTSAVGIPAQIQGKPVTAIGDNVFSGKLNVSMVNIPESVTTIGANAFNGCVAMSSIIIPSSVSSIGSGAFSGCVELTSISIPSSVTVIENNVFSATGISIATIPSGVTSIGDGAFANCSVLSIAIIPESVTSIGDTAFQNSANVVIHAREGSYAYSYAAAKSIARYTLTDFTRTETDGKLTITGYTGAGGEVTVPAQIDGKPITTIGSSAFYQQTSITSINLPDSITTIGSSAFGQCTGLTSVHLPASITTIGSTAFSRCTGLTSFTVPNNVAVIDNSIFSGCSALTSVVLGSGVTTVNASSFSGCTSLIAINVDSANTTYASQDGVLMNALKTELILYPIGKSGAYSIPEGVITIAASAFSGSAITSITIPSSVTTIGNLAFQGSALTSVTVPSTVTSIGTYAFKNCKALLTADVQASITKISASMFEENYELTSVTLPSTLSGIIDSYAFYNCYKLASINIPEGTTMIGGYAFYNCSELTTIVMPNSVTATSNNVFTNCSKLTTVTLSSNMTQINGDLFSGCTALTSIVIPNSVTSIGTNAFRSCSNLISATIPKTVTAIGSNAFQYCSAHLVIYGENNSYAQTYARANNISFQGSYYFTETETTVIVTGYNGTVVDLKIPETIDGKLVVGLGENAFANTSSLTSVQLPSSVLSIGAGAFSSCANLTSVIIPAGVTSIGIGAFVGGNTSLTIKGYEGTVAQTYATENSIAFQVITPPAKLHIAMVYGGNRNDEGNSENGVPVSHSFVEIFNPNDFDVSLGGYSLQYMPYSTQYASKRPANWYKLNLDPTKTIPAKCSYLINCGATADGTSVVLTTFDQVWTGAPGFCTKGAKYFISYDIDAISANIVNPFTAKGGLPIDGYIDLLGSAGNDIGENHLVDGFEGAYYGGASGTSKKKGLGRTNRAIDTDNNLNDFMLIDFEFSGARPRSLVDGPIASEPQSTIDFTFTDDGTGITIIAYIGEGGEVTIPSQLASKPVTAIGAGAFEGKTAVTAIHIPASITTIAETAFKGCTGLTSVSLPSGLQTIGASAFEGAVNLKFIAIPASVTAIGSTAFGGISEITIYGYAGTYAQNFATENTITFKPITAGQSKLVIGMYYGSNWDEKGTSTSGLPISHSFVEIYNPNDFPVSLAGYSLHYQGFPTQNINLRTGDTWAKLDLDSSAVIPPNHSFLINTGINSEGVWGTAPVMLTHFDQTWTETPGICTKGAKFVITYGVDTIAASTVNPFTANGGQPIAGYIDMVGSAGNDPELNDQIDGCETEFAEFSSKQKGFVRIDRNIDTDNNRTDFLLVDFRSSELRPRSLADGLYVPPAPVVREIFSVDDVTGIQVPNGTSKEDAAAQLPSTLTVTLDDSSTTTVNVTWDSTEYAAQTAGIYSFTGTLSWGDDPTISNSWGLVANATVEVLEGAQPAELLAGISPENVTITYFENREVTIDIHVDKVNNLKNFMIDFTYDPTLLELQNKDSDSDIYYFNDDNGTVRLIATLEQAVSSEEAITVYTLRFKMKPAAKDQTATVTLTGFSAGILEGSGAELTAQITKPVSTVIMPSFSYDINDNGEVNLGDLVYAEFFYGAKENDTNWDEAKAVDTDGDGFITTADFVNIALYIAQNYVR